MEKALLERKSVEPITESKENSQNHQPRDSETGFEIEMISHISPSKKPNILAGLLAMITGSAFAFTGFVSVLLLSQNQPKTFSDLKSMNDFTHLFGNSDNSIKTFSLMAGCATWVNISVLGYLSYMFFYNLKKKKKTVAIWPFITALSYAEIGRLSLGFLGAGLSYVGFFLNLILFTNFRYQGTYYIFYLLSKKNRCLNYFENLFYSPNVPWGKNDVVEGKINDAFIKFADRIYDSEFEDFSKKSWICNKYRAADIFGVVVSIILNIPVLFVMAQKMVAGLESLTFNVVDLGHGSHYQKWWTILLGCVGVAPTPFFYAMSMTSLFSNVLDTGYYIKRRYDSKHYGRAVLLTGLSVLAVGLSFLGRYALYGVALSVVNGGYLDYLNIKPKSDMGEAVAQSLSTLAIGVALSLYLKLFNQYIGALKLSEIHEINKDSLRDILRFYPHEINVKETSIYKNEFKQSFFGSCAERIKSCFKPLPSNYQDLGNYSNDPNYSNEDMELSETQAAVAATV